MGGPPPSGGETRTSAGIRKEETDLFSYVDGVHPDVHPDGAQ